MRLLFGLLSRKIIRGAKKRDIEYSFLFMHPDGPHHAEIGELLRAGSILSVIGESYPFDHAKEAFASLETGRAKGKVVVQMQ